MPITPILPYPRQLPQDYYAKNLPAVPVVAPPTPESPDITPVPPYIPPDAATSSGGVYYGDSPPLNPQYGWLWTRGSGYLYVYTAPGIWSQVGTNW